MSNVNRWMTEFEYSMDSISIDKPFGRMDSENFCFCEIDISVNCVPIA
ncbi:hypothetical protein X946_5022 [Burkholderia sp. ABCPW 111]|nr:hypothetical protein X946_5022 [Burkholderia sp. ABCPW 111]